MSDTEWTAPWLALAAGGTPPSSIHQYSFIWNLYRNLIKRLRVGYQTCSNQPTHNFEWAPIPDGIGTIDSVVSDGTLINVIDGSTPSAVFIDGDSKERWVSWPGGPGQTFNGSGVNEDAPADYDVVLNVDSRNPWEVLGPYPIIDSTQTGVDGEVITSLVIADDGTLTINEALSALAGKKYAIIKRGGYHWHQRVPARPVWFYNRNTSISSSTTTSLTDLTQNWAVDDPEIVGQDLITIINGKLTRIVIDSNTPNTLVFAAQTHAPATGYYITPHELYWQPRLVPTQDKPFQWYRGLMDTATTHWASDTLAEYSTVAKLTEEVEPGDDVDVYFVDAYRGVGENPDDHIFAPHINKTLPMVQAAIEAAGSLFILQFDLIDEDHSNQMWYGWPALMYCTIEGDYREKTITAESGGTATWSGSISFPDGETSRDDVFAVRFIDGLPSDHLEGVTMTATTIEYPGLAVGDKVGISFGGVRTEPRRVFRIYPRIVWVPDVELNEFGEVILVHDPPTDEYPGFYERRDPTTHYAVYDRYGALAIDGGREFQDNDLVRYCGSNRADPTEYTHGFIEYPTQWRSYYDYLCICNSAPSSPTRRDQKQWKAPDTLSGVVVSADSTSITVDTHLWPDTTPRKTHTGTADGSSSDSILEDTTKLTDGYWASMAGTRFEVGLAILRSEINPGVWEKKLCIEQNSTTELVPHSPFSATTSGKSYEILEAPGENGLTGPGISSYLIAHTLVVTEPDGTEHTTEILGHDDTTFFSAEGLSGGYTAQPGDTWSIRYHRVGDVVRWNGSSFVDPGTFPGVPRRNLNCTYITQYGRLRKGDAVRRDRDVLLQFKKMIDKMHLTPFTAGWDNNSEDNVKTGNVTNNSPPTYPWASLRSDFNTMWSGTSPYSDIGAPYVETRIGIVPVGPFKEASDTNKYSYLTGSPFQCERFNLTERQIQYWVYATSNFPPGGPNYVTGLYDVGNNGGLSGYVYYEPASISGTGGTSSITHNTWNKVLDIASSDATIQILIGDDTHASQLSASNPTITDITEPINYSGQTYAYVKATYLTYTFAVVDWTEAFDADI